MEMTMNRRRLLRYGSGLGLTLAGMSAPLVRADSRDPRFVLIILRGGMDGLAAVPAFGDGAYRRVRGELRLPEPDASGGTRDLDGFFGLHRSFANLHSMYRDGELAVVHAIAPPYRERSHFDGQDVLEAGVPDPSGSSTGWLYRALEVLPHANDALYAYALGSSVPLVLRGPEVVGSWAPDQLPAPDEGTMARLMALYDEDERLGPKLQAAFEGDEMAGELRSGRGANQLGAIARAAAGFLSNPDGPRIAVLDSVGWDTHARQGAGDGPLATRFAALDSVLGELRIAMGTHWRETVVAAVTEFGRTVAMNGTRGSDHGYGGAAFVLGGAVRGGRVIADWPGLGTGRLHEGRDLLATTDVRALFAGILTDHMGVESSAVADVVFPGYKEVLANLVVTA
jgi:uncharacterized protein (DUF1501 family)